MRLDRIFYILFADRKTCSWALVYEDGFATFQGVSPTKEVKGYIAVNSDASLRFFSASVLLTRFQGTKLIYSSQPSKFMLQRLDENRDDIFLYVPPVTSDLHMFTIESYIQGEVR